MTGGEARTLEDAGTTVEDLDAQGEYEMSTYRRSRITPLPGPASPDQPVPPGAGNGDTQR